MTLTLAVDAMGGDHGPQVIVPAVADFLARQSQARAIVFGLDEALKPFQTQIDGHPRLEARHAAEVVAMDEAPTKALRGKRQSSMRLALNAVKEGTAHACVSAGNTGALMAMARYTLGMIDGVDRPAIVRPLPSLGGVTYVLDLGANAECEPEHLLQFAVMGAVLAGALENQSDPTVGLLNIGTEPNKGNDLVQRAAELMNASRLNYHGFVEGNDIYAGTVDVVVCDGFVGNIVLKTSEGLAAMIAEYMRRNFTANLPSRLAGLVALPVLRRFRRQIDPRRHNGASLLGLGGTVVKSHGSSDRLATVYALEKALTEASTRVPELIRERVSHLLPREQVA